MPIAETENLLKALPGDIGVGVITLVIVWYVIRDIITVLKRNSTPDAVAVIPVVSDDESLKDILKLLRENTVSLAVIKEKIDSLRLGGQSQ